MHLVSSVTPEARGLWEPSRHRGTYGQSNKNSPLACGIVKSWSLVESGSSGRGVDTTTDPVQGTLEEVTLPPVRWGGWETGTPDLLLLRFRLCQQSTGLEGV